MPPQDHLVGGPQPVGPVGPGDYYGNESDGVDVEGGGIDTRPGLGTRLLHRMASEPGRYSGVRGGAGSNTLGYHRQYPANGGGGGGGRHMNSSSGRHYSGSGLDYASDTDALHSPAGSVVGSVSHRMSRHQSRNMNGGMSTRYVSSLFPFPDIAHTNRKHGIVSLCTSGSWIDAAISV
jgi:hypothetical protein